MYSSTTHVNSTDEQRNQQEIVSDSNINEHNFSYAFIHTLDIILYQNYIPMELRQLVNIYHQVPLDDSNIHAAVKLWCK